MKTPIYILPHGIEVIGEYAPNGSNRYWRLRIKEHHLFSAKVVSGGMGVRRSRVVMTSVLGRSLLDSEHVHHKDEDVNNDSPDNLKIMSAAEHNKCHKIGKKHSEESKKMISDSLKIGYANGNIKHSDNNGEKNPSAKLNVKQVKDIRASNISSRKLASFYNVSKTTILYIKSRKTWSKM